MKRIRFSSVRPRNDAGRSMRFLSLGLVVLVGSGCVFANQAVVLSPAVSPPRYSIGSGEKVQLLVVDERTTPDYGRRVGGYGPMAKIQGDAQNVQTTFESAIADALRGNGYEVATATTPAQMRVEIRSIEYSGGQTLFAFQLEARATVKAFALQDGRSLYEQVYRGESELTSPIATTAGQNESLINQAVSQALSTLVSDRSLFEALRSAPAQQ